MSRTYFFARITCITGAVAGVILALGAFAGPLRADDQPPGKPIPTGGEFEDPVQPLVPKHPRTEADRDRLEATALFASGRMLEQKKEFTAALRKYERAVRLDPTADTILREIMPLAFTLGRQAEAVRYAAKLAEHDASDPALSLQIGRYLTAEGTTDRALAVYHKALAKLETAPESAVKTRLWMEVGRIHFLNKEFAPAADAFAHVNAALDQPEKFALDAVTKKELLGDKGFAYELFGECALEADRLADATAAFEKFNKLAPSKAVLAFNQARVLAKQKKPADALAKLQTYFDARDTSRGVGPFEFLADVLKQLDREGELVERLEKLYEKNADNLPLAAYLARQYVLAKKPEKAEPIWQRMLAKQPVAEAYEGLAEVYRLTKQPDALLKHLGVVIAKANSLEGLGRERKLLVADAPLVASLVEAARKKLKEKPDSLDADGRQAVALLALEAKQYETAAEFFAAALDFRPRKNSAEMLLTWGLELFAAERFDEAIKVFQRGIDDRVLPDDNPAFYFYLAGALEFAGKTDDALKAAREAIQRKPKSPRFDSRLPWIFYHAKRYDDALKAYVEFIDKYNDDVSAEEVRDVLRETRLAVSNVCVLKHDLPQAEEWLEQVLDEYPDDIGAMNDLGYLWADENKNLNRALTMTLAAVAAEPKNQAYRDSLGWALFRLGRHEEALTELLQAVPAKDPDGTVLEHVGDVYAKLNKTADALDYWRRAAAALEKSPEADKIKAVKAKIAATEKDGK